VGSVLAPPPGSNNGIVTATAVGGLRAGDKVLVVCPMSRASKKTLTRTG